MTRAQAIKDLTSLPNIGSTMAEYLYDMGIESVTEFKDSDPQQVWEQLKQSKTKANICQMHLRALVAAHRGVPISQLENT